MNSPILVVGLGNPGPSYATTRHNVGQMVADALAKEIGARFSVHKKTNTEVADGFLGGRKMIVAKLRSYMNLSGGPTKALAGYFHIPAERIVVVHDELELDFGSVRLRLGGGDKGHNGLKDITKALGTSDYQRLSVGIGRPPGRMAPRDFVLKPFSKKEADELPFVCIDAIEELEAV